MRIMTLVAALLLAGVFSQAKAIPEEGAYGEKLSPKPAQTISEAVKNFKDLKGKKIVISGQVEKVCEKKGCWMTIEDKGLRVRTLFKDYGFFVPKNLVGKRIKAEGTIVQKEISQAAARHFLKDEGAPQSEVEKIQGKQKVFQFIAEGVEEIKI